MPPSVANRVWIDETDHCDGCKENRKLGVSFGYQKAVICFECIAVGNGLLDMARLVFGNDSSLLPSSEARTGDHGSQFTPNKVKVEYTPPK